MTPSDFRIEQLLATLTLPAKVRLLSGETAWTTYAEPAVGLRSMVMSDGPVGVRGTSWDERDVAAVTPSPTALAATWNPGLIAEIGALLAGEARRKGVDVLLAPTVNLHRTPLGGRHFECFSEDPYLTARIGAAYVSGLQAHGVGATIKHYVANDSETERMTYEAVIDEQALHELYLRPFEEIVAEARPWLVMAAYNAVNGPTMTENALLIDPLETRWGFDGVVVSDWTAVRSTVAAAAAATDLAMPGPATPWSDGALVAAVREGAVPEAAIDAKVRRLLRLAARVGALEPVEPVRPPRRSNETLLLRRAAAEGAVLVRNDGVLPLLGPDRPPVRRVAVIGPPATELRIQGGGSAWVSPRRVAQPLAALVAALAPTVEVVHAAGPSIDPRLRPFTPDQVRDPVDGTPGLRVRLRAADGRELRDEHRDTGRLLWMQDRDVEEIAEIEAECEFVAPADGRYELGFAALGNLTGTVDGEVIHAGMLEPSEPDDLTPLLAPTERVQVRTLRAGQRVRYSARLRPGELRRRRVALLVLGARRVNRDAEELIAEAAQVAATSDVAIVLVGTTELIETEGRDRTDLALPGRQDDLVRGVLAANPRTVVVVNSGAPVELPWLDDVAAALLFWFPGQDGGTALADVLTGAVEPGGRLPTTWPRRTADGPVLSPLPIAGRLEYAEGIHLGYRGWLRDSTREPALAFGFGLGYTSWEFSGLELIAPADPASTLEAVVRVSLVNTGSRPGRQTVQVYLARPDFGVERPARWLAGFGQVVAEAGEKATVDVPLARDRFAHWSTAEHDWRVEPGPYEIHVGSDVLTTPLSATLAVS